jgi:uncharacterized membrane protein
MSPAVLGLVVFALVAAFAAGVGLGQARKRDAVTAAYGEVQPVLTALRRLLDSDLLTAPRAHALHQRAAQMALATYEREVRKL